MKYNEMELRRSQSFHMFRKRFKIKCMTIQMRYYKHPCHSTEKNNSSREEGYFILTIPLIPYNIL